MKKIKDLIQIAGVSDRNEANLLMACGVEYLGFPLRLPINKEDISDADAAEIIQSLKKPYKGILITYLETAEEIFNLCKYLGTTYVQIHGKISIDEMHMLKQMYPEIQIFKSLIIRKGNVNSLKNDIEIFSPIVNAFITDTYDPISGACGATGKTHDWKISRYLVEISPIPVILAGGLNPKNVRQAILQVRPAGVDVHTGVENKWGRKDKNLVMSFIFEAKKGFESISKKD
ncbi:phosphoribosylanthranilate isomerase [Methanoregula sp.]|uniref:phosphoribosylanthranilate isomerase n=1 Tax=Methanoregula sp. TaxID=2052170 RepID=UPI003564FBD2